MPIEIGGVSYYSAKEVQEHLGVARQTLWRWRKALKIPQGHRYRNRQLFFSANELEQICRFANQLDPVEPTTGLDRKRDRGD